MNPEPIWDWLSSVQFLGRYRVEGESSKFRNSVGYITAMNALQCNAMATDAIMAKVRLPKGDVVGQCQFTHTLFGLASLFLSDPPTATESLTSVFPFATVNHDLRSQRIMKMS